MKDIVTYQLSAITGDEEESRIDQLERELVAARAELAEARNQRDKAIAKARERRAKVSEAERRGAIRRYLWS